MKIERANLQGARRVMSLAKAGAPVKRLPMHAATNSAVASLTVHPCTQKIKLVITHCPV